MILIVGILLTLGLLSHPNSAQASNIPLFYQLIEAYKPSTYSFYGSPIYNLPISNTNTTTNTTDISSTSTGNITIAVLGDSMIDTLGTNIPQLLSGLSKYYPKKQVKILNYGYGSSTLEYAYTRLNQEYNYKNQHFPSLISQSPDIVIIESFAYNNFGNTQNGFDKQNGLLDQIINDIHEQLPKTKIIFAATIAPNSVIFANNSSGAQFTSLEKIEKTSTIKKYLENHIKYANDKHIPLANTYTPSLANNEGQKQFINPDDNIHPSSYGGQFFCDILAKALFDNHLLD